MEEWRANPSFTDGHAREDPLVDPDPGAHRCFPGNRKQACLIFYTVHIQVIQPLSLSPDRFSVCVSGLIFPPEKWIWNWVFRGGSKDRKCRKWKISCRAVIFVMERNLSNCRPCSENSFLESGEGESITREETIKRRSTWGKMKENVEGGVAISGISRRASWISGNVFAKFLSAHYFFITLCFQTCDIHVF